MQAFRSRGWATPVGLRLDCLSDPYFPVCVLQRLGPVKPAVAIS